MKTWACSMPASTSASISSAVPIVKRPPASSHPLPSSTSSRSCESGLVEHGDGVAPGGPRWRSLRPHARRRRQARTRVDSSASGYRPARRVPGRRRGETSSPAGSRRPGGAAVRITRQRRLVDDVAGGVADQGVAQPGPAAQHHARRGSRPTPPRRARSPRRRAASPRGRSPRPPAGRARPRWRPRRPRTPPPPPSPAPAPWRARLSSALGTRASSGSTIGTSNIHSASITAPPSPTSSFSSAARRPAVCTMSSLSGSPRIGTRIEPYSPPCAPGSASAPGP